MKGWARLRLEGLGAEKLLNTLLQKQIRAAYIKRSKRRGIDLSVPVDKQKQVEMLAQEKGFSVTVLNGGLRQMLYGMKKRWVLGAGLALGLCLAALSLQFVWLVEVEDAGKYAGEVRLFLQEENIRSGILQSSVDAAYLQEKLQWRLPKVKWVWVKQEGVRLHIRLEEGVAAREQPAAAGDVVAAMDGVVERLTVFSGTAACKEGDAVQKGQVLIHGWEEDKEGNKTPVQAAGEAMARVWAEKTIRMQTWEMVTQPTGREESRMLYKTPFGIFTFEQEPDFLMADRVWETYALPGAWLPVQLIRERFVECSGEYTQREWEQVTLEAEKAAKEALVRAWPETADIDKSIKISMIERGIIEVAATAELKRDIAQYGQAP